MRNIAEVTTAVANGDLSKKVTVDVKGEVLELKQTINTMVDQLSSFAAEVTRVAKDVGTEGKLGGQAEVVGVSGTWKDLTENVNTHGEQPHRPGAEHRRGHDGGRERRPLAEDHRRGPGRGRRARHTINTMVDQLRSFAAEVTRVAREVGTEGKLGGQARSKGVSGTWRDLTDNVNSMADNLTGQVRNIATVTTAVANGDLSQEDHGRREGRDLRAEEHDQHDGRPAPAFAAEVTRVAREVGTEGSLGGQATVDGVSGIWKDLTGSVNFMAANSPSQVRNIATVTTAVANGDLSQEGHRRRQGRGARAEGHDQHDGRPALARSPPR